MKDWPKRNELVISIMDISSIVGMGGLDDQLFSAVEGREFRVENLLLPPCLTVGWRPKFHWIGGHLKIGQPASEDTNEHSTAKHDDDGVQAAPFSPPSECKPEATFQCPAQRLTKPWGRNGLLWRHRHRGTGSVLGSSLWLVRYHSVLFGLFDDTHDEEKDNNKYDEEESHCEGEHFQTHDLLRRSGSDFRRRYGTRGMTVLATARLRSSVRLRIDERLVAFIRNSSHPLNFRNCEIHGVVDGERSKAIGCASQVGEQRLGGALVGSRATKQIHDFLVVARENDILARIIQRLLVLRREEHGNLLDELFAEAKDSHGVHENRLIAAASHFAIQSSHVVPTRRAPGGELPHRTQVVVEGNQLLCGTARFLSFQFGAEALHNLLSLGVVQLPCRAVVKTVHRFRAVRALIVPNAVASLVFGSIVVFLGWYLRETKMESDNKLDQKDKQYILPRGFHRVNLTWPENARIQIAAATKNLAIAYDKSSNEETLQANRAFLMVRRQIREDKVQF